MSSRAKRWGAAGFRYGTGAAALVMLWQLSGLPVAVDRIQVTGADTLGEARIRELADVTPDSRMSRAAANAVRERLLRHPGLAGVTVTRGITGTLHVRVREREPAVWIEEASCAAGVDGVLLPHVTERSATWIILSGLTIVRGRVREVAALRDALAGERHGRRIRGEGRTAGTWRWIRSRTGGLDATASGSVLASGSWIWRVSGKRIRLTSPVREGELVRLGRFIEERPAAWERSRRLDLRFAERVVTSR